MAAALLAPGEQAGPRAAEPRTIYVDASGSGDGRSPASALRSVQEAIALAAAGDTVVVAAGEYRERLNTVNAGAAESPITVRAADGARPLVTAPGRVLSVGHPHVHVEGLVLDGQFGADDTVRVGSPANGTQLRRVEVRRSGRDCIDMGAPSDVLVEGSLVHHCLNPAGGRSDAHGIVATAARRLTIRDTEIHTFSGDAVQLDPSRSPPGWDELTIEGCRFWLAPLPSPQNGFAAGVVPGENGIDTKTYDGGARARLLVRNTTFEGFRGGLITNMAALNLKEFVDAVIDGVTVSASEIAFRMRGRGATGARVLVANAVVFDASVAFRYEDDIRDLRIFHATIGSGVKQAFQRASAPASVLDVRNLLLLGTQLPTEAADRSNLATGPASFVDAAAGNYRLAANSPAIDRAIAIPGITTDRDGRRRPQGPAPDTGAHEWCPGTCEPPAPPEGVRVVGR